MEESRRLSIAASEWQANSAHTYQEFREACQLKGRVRRARSIDILRGLTAHHRSSSHLSLVTHTYTQLRPTSEMTLRKVSEVGLRSPESALLRL